MTESRKSPYHPKEYKEKSQHAAARALRRTGAVSTGAAAYREEFGRDYGADLDEPLDATESGKEF